MQKGNFEFSAQIDPKTWGLGAGSKPGCRLKQMLLAQSLAQMMGDGRWSLVAG